jgi:transcriptional regulator with XRE-family HTH domain
MAGMYMTPIARNRFSQERFPPALKGLMDERHLSYRQLAYKTKLSAGYLNHLTKGTRPVPADSVIAVIAEALLVEPDFFLEYRLRQVAAVLDESPSVADTLYGILLRKQPVNDDLAASLQEAQRALGNGHAEGNGNGHGHADGNGNGRSRAAAADERAVGF